MRPLRALLAIDGRAAAALVAVGALASYAAQGLVWPLAAGRDWQDYVISWHEVARDEPLFPALMLARAPLTPLVYGPALELGGAHLAEVVAGLLYAVTVVLWTAVARRHGRLAAGLVAGFLVVPPTFGLFFRQVGSDPVFACVLSLVALLAARAVEAPSVVRYALLGGAVAAAVLARPAAVPLLLLGVLVLVGVRARRWAVVRPAAAFAAAALLPLAAYALYNGVRFDDVAIGRGGAAGIPGYRAFVVERIVERDNGAATRELARAIEDDLLGLEPYRSLELSADDVLGLGQTWVWDDLVAMSDRVWGWDDDYAHLGAAGREAVRAHPGAYAGGVARTVRDLAFERYTGPPGAGWVGQLRAPGDPPPPLPDAAAGDAIPSVALVNNWALTAPDPRFRIVGGLYPRTGVLWSPYEKRDLEWETAADDRRYEELRAIVIDRLRQLSRTARHRGEPVLRAAMRLTPGIGWWVLAAAAVWLLRRPRGVVVPLVLAVASAAILLETALGFPADRNYAAPFLPVAVLLLATVVSRSLDGRGRASPYPPRA
jgi:hypothetical protein